MVTVCLVVLACVTLFAVYSHRAEESTEEATSETIKEDSEEPQLSRTLKPGVGSEANPTSRVSSSDDAVASSFDHGHQMPSTNLDIKPKTAMSIEAQGKSNAREIFQLSGRTIENVATDCAGSRVANCIQLVELANQSLSRPNGSDVGWANWMELEILASVTAAPQIGRSTKVAASCGHASCVLQTQSPSINDVFEGAFTQQLPKFEQWISQQLWMEELAPVHRKDGSESRLAWQILSWEGAPFTVTYVFRRKE
jgi:hypothetical protein